MGDENNNNETQVIPASQFNELKAAHDALVEQTKTLIKPEIHQAVLAERDILKSAKEQADTAAQAAKEAALTSKRQALVGRGVPAEKVNTMNEHEISLIEVALDVSKPGMDKGGGGSAGLIGSPMELAVQAYSIKK
jgi:hypothetical protein